MFKQSLHDGNQVETPDYWLGIGNPWEIRRDDKQYPVRYFGQVRTLVENGRTLYYQDGGEVVVAVPYDMPIPGYGTMNVSNLRMWDSRPSTVRLVFVF
jgi:starch phosphorylase